MKNKIVTTTLLTIMAAASSQAAILNFVANLGPEAAGATGTGSANFSFDTTLQKLSIDTSWSGLSGNTTVSHIHCCTAVAGTGTAGVSVTPSTLPGFPTGVKSGSYSIVLDLNLATTYTAGALTAGGGTPAGASAFLLQGIQDGKAYLNIHTSTFGGGEIRGFLTPVPEPGTFALAGLALATTIMARRLKA
jgi:CHRD domain/PEP-CTERM motif